MSEDQHLGSTKTIEIKKIIYSLNAEQMTASVVGLSPKSRYHIHIHIPYSINYNSDEYIITSISEYAFSYSFCGDIDFAFDSKLQIIEKNAFNESNIEKSQFHHKSFKLESVLFIIVNIFILLILNLIQNFKLLEKKHFLIIEN